jgi:hypothetical protein
MTKIRRVLAIAVAVAALVGATGTPAFAQDDSFYISSDTPSDCPDSGDPAGYLYFVDYGEGDLSDPAKNDDYVTLRDTCANGDGVRGYVWHNGAYQGSVYNGGGFDAFVVWDPFGNVLPGESVGLKVCSVNGPNGSPYHCSNRIDRRSQDG